MRALLFITFELSVSNYRKKEDNSQQQQQQIKQAITTTAAAAPGKIYALSAFERKNFANRSKKFSTSAAGAGAVAACCLGEEIP